MIGLTVVAFGTSSPELAVSVQSSFAGQADLALGNVVGSNLFNLLAVLGLSGLVAPDGIEVAPGALFVGFYAVYTLYLVLVASRHDALSAFSAAMMTFVLPLTAVTLVGPGDAKLSLGQKRVGERIRMGRNLLAVSEPVCYTQRGCV